MSYLLKITKQLNFYQSKIRKWEVKILYYENFNQSFEFSKFWQIFKSVKDI